MGRRVGAIDVHVANRIRKRREELGLSYRTVAREIGVSWQQVQKYELGLNRVSAEHLFRLSLALDVEVEYFFEAIESGARIAD
jgi:transcriptional regulator with XRE-family HTH domain